jgi:hypothetical protein
MNTTTTAAAKKNLDTAEIAKLIRADIKTAIKAGTLPKAAKYTVRIDRYSMGSSIYVTAKALPFAVLNVDAYHIDRSFGSKYVTARPCDAYTVEAAAVLAKLNEIVDAYHDDRSDMMTDYYCVNFGKNVEVQEAEGEFAAIEAAVLAREAVSA